MERLGIVLAVDGTLETTNGIKLVSTSTKDLAKELDALSQKQDANAASSGKNAQAVQTLGKELANGNFKGAAADAAKLALSSEMLTAGMLGVGAVVGGVVLGVGALAVAAMQGAQEERALNDSLLLTGNYAGMVAGQLDAMASSVARNIGGSVSDSRDVLATLTASGKFTVESLSEVSEAVQLVARFSGQTNAQVAKNFESMGDDAVKWSVKTNDSYHFLQLSTYEYIKRLQEQGRNQEAARVSSQALSDHLGGSLSTNLGTLEKAWKGVSNWAKDAWQSMMNVGKTETAEQKIEGITARINALNTRQSTGRITADQRAQLVATLENERAILESDQRQDRTLALRRSAREQADSAAIKAAEDKKNGKGGGRGAGDSELEQQRRLIAKNAGLNPDFTEQWNRLTEVQRKNGLTVEWLTDAQAKLLAEQPAMREEARLQTEAARTETQYREAQARIMDQYLATLERDNDAQRKTNDNLRDQAQQAGLTKEQIGYLKAARLDDVIAQEQANLATAEASNADARRIELMKEHIKLLQEQKGLQTDLTAKTALADLNKKQEEASRKYGEDIRRDFRDGMTRGLEDGKSPLKAFGDTLGNIVKTRLSESFADSILNGFEPLFKRVLANISIPGLTGGGGGGSSGLGGLVSGLFGSIFGGGAEAPAGGLDMDNFFNAKGNAFSSMGGIQAFAKGGTFTNSIVNQPTLFKFAKGTGMMGEAGPEAIMPLKRGPDGSLGVVAGGGGSGGVNIAVNVQTLPGTTADVQQKQGADGGVQIDVILRQLTEAIADGVNSGTGALHSAMESRYGLTTQVN